MRSHYTLALDLDFSPVQRSGGEIWHHFAYYLYHFLRYAYIYTYLLMSIIYYGWTLVHVVEPFIELWSIVVNVSRWNDNCICNVPVSWYQTYVLDCFLLYDSWTASIELGIPWDVIRWKWSHVMLCGTLITLEYQWNHKDNHSKPKGALKFIFSNETICVWPLVVRSEVILLLTTHLPFSNI